MEPLALAMCSLIGVMMITSFFSDGHLKWWLLLKNVAICSSLQVTVTSIYSNYFYKWYHLKWWLLLKNMAICSLLLKWPSLLSSDDHFFLLTSTWPRPLSQTRLPFYKVAFQPTCRSSLPRGNGEGRLGYIGLRGYNWTQFAKGYSFWPLLLSKKGLSLINQHTVVDSVLSRFFGF